MLLIPRLTPPVIERHDTVGTHVDMLTGDDMMVMVMQNWIRLVISQIRKHCYRLSREL